MAELIEGSIWVNGIYQLETDDPVLGGEEGIDNLQAKQLASRTQWLKTGVELRALINSPAFTGVPTVPTPALGTNTNQIVNAAFVQDAITALINSSPAALDTLNELAAALGNDADFATTITNALALKAPLNSPVLTGDPKAPTPAPGDNDASIATTAFVQDAIAALSNVTVAIQGAYKNIKGSSTGSSAVVTYTIDEIITGDGAGEYLTTRNWNGTITMTVAGAGGLDTGAVAASTWYYAFAITKDDGTKALIASLSATSPSFANAPGYTKWARIGTFFTDSTANKYPMGFTQKNGKTTFKISAGSNLTAMRQMASGTSVGVWTAIGTSLFVPPTAVAISLAILAGTSGNAYITVAPNNSYPTPSNPAGTGTIYPIYSGAGNTTSSSHSGISDMILESSNIYFGSSDALAKVICMGYIDNI